VEPGGLVYRRGVREHGYQIRRGDSAVVVAGSLAVRRELLRHAAARVRPATARELAALHVTDRLFVSDVPGYRGQAQGMPLGVSYTPADHTGDPTSVLITFSAERTTTDQLCFQATCAAESGGLTYLRRPDQHGYALGRGEVHVVTTGGVSVDRALLRRATLDARPATDAELLRALPEPGGRGPLDRLRGWLRAHT
jgi:hypothetical protein